MAVKKNKNNKSKKEEKNSSREAKKSITKPKKTVAKGKEEPKVVFSRAKYIAMSPRKARLVIDLVRGEKVTEALEKLYFVRKKAVEPIKKAIESAAANAVNNFEMDRKKLVVVKALVDEAPTYKRGRAGSRGRYKKILKRNCHITIGVEEK